MSNDIQEKINQERQAAREACETNGATSAECAVAWDTVEELQAEAAHQKQKVSKNSLQEYFDDNPDALECRVYDN
jgi:CP12 domain